MKRQKLRGLDESAVRVALEVRLRHAAQMAEHVAELRPAAVQPREHQREDRHHADAVRARDPRARRLDRQEVARAAVEVRDHHVAEALDRERAPHVSQKRDRGRGAERDGARLRHRVARGPHERQLQERARVVAFGQEAQRALGQTLALQAISADRQVRAVHLHRRAGHEHHRALAVDRVELLLGQGLPADRLRCRSHAGELSREEARTGSRFASSSQRSQSRAALAASSAGSPAGSRTMPCVLW